MYSFYIYIYIFYIDNMIYTNNTRYFIRAENQFSWAVFWLCFSCSPLTVFFIQLLFLQLSETRNPCRWTKTSQKSWSYLLQRTRRPKWKYPQGFHWSEWRRTYDAIIATRWVIETTQQTNWPQVLPYNQSTCCFIAHLVCALQREFAEPINSESFNWLLNNKSLNWETVGLIIS